MVWLLPLKYTAGSPRGILCFMGGVCGLHAGPDAAHRVPTRPDTVTHCKPPFGSLVTLSYLTAPFPWLQTEPAAVLMHFCTSGYNYGAERTKSLSFCRFKLITHGRALWHAVLRAGVSVSHHGIRKVWVGLGMLNWSAMLVLRFVLKADRPH